MDFARSTDGFLLSPDNLAVMANYIPKFRADCQPGCSVPSSPKFVESLRTRFECLHRQWIEKIHAGYVLYRCEADRLEEEATDTYLCQALLQLGSNEPKGSDLVKNHQVLMEMRAVCMTRIAIFESGGLDLIIMFCLLEQEHDRDVMEIYQTLPDVREHVDTRWCFLPGSCEKLLRLKLMWLLAPDGTKPSGQATPAAKAGKNDEDDLSRQMNGLGLGDAQQQARIQYHLNEMLQKLSLGK
jgi:hypothetical protein